MYSPEVGYALVSIGWLDECGYSAILKAESVLSVMVMARQLDVPKSRKVLYKVVRKDGEVSFAAMEKLAVMELHRHVGHCNQENLTTCC